MARLNSVDNEKHLPVRAKPCGQDNVGRPVQAPKKEAEEHFRGDLHTDRRSEPRVAYNIGSDGR